MEMEQLQRSIAPRDGFPVSRCGSRIRGALSGIVHHGLPTKVATATARCGRRACGLAVAHVKVSRRSETLGNGPSRERQVVGVRPIESPAMSVIEKTSLA